MKSFLPVLCVCLLFVLLGLLRLNDLSLYTADSCRYMIWGNSVAHGKGFVDDTQPVPDRFVVNAPFYAVLIAPIQIIFPLSIVAVKVWTLGFAVLALLLCYFWMRPLTGELPALVLIILLALNPFFLVLSTEVLSEAPFIAAVLVVFILCEKLSADPENKRALVALILCAPILGLLREVGIMLAFAAGLHFYIRKRRRTAFAIVGTSIVVAACWYFRNQYWAAAAAAGPRGNLNLLSEHLVTPADTSLGAEMALRVWLAAKAYGAKVAEAILYPLSGEQYSALTIDQSPLYRSLSAFLMRWNWVFALVLLSGIGIGIVHDMRSSRTALIRLVFLSLFLLTVFVYPMHDLRYIAPLLPLMLWYIVRAFQWFAGPGRWPAEGGSRVALISIAVVLCLLPNLAGMYEVVKANIRFRQDPESVIHYPSIPRTYAYRWGRVSSWIQDHIPENSVIASPVKDIVLVAGTRKVLEINAAVALPNFESLLRAHDVRFVFAVPWWKNLAAYEFLMRESRRYWFDAQPGSPGLFRVHSRFLEPVAPGHYEERSDTLDVVNLLRMGRREIMRENYAIARSLLERALSLAPDEAEVLYQAMIADLLTGNAADARNLLQRITSRPQSFDYVDHARNLWDAFERTERAARSGIPEERGVLTYQAASIYWEAGYPRVATRLLNEFLQEDSSYFIGAMWAVNDNLQMGDMPRARQQYSRLRRLDSANVITVSFGRILTLTDSLPFCRDSLDRGRLHDSIGITYRSIDLLDEAIDEAEMALHDNPNDAAALFLLAGIYEQRSLPARAIGYYREILTLNPRDSTAAARLDALRQPPG